MTILFADVTDSTGLGERLDPEQLQEVLGDYFQAMREEIEGEGGTVEKFIGDAVMAAFGVPVAHEDDPARALRAALRMRRRLSDVNRRLEERFGVTLDIRTGVNTGEVLAATSPVPGEPMVTGDAVNVAARLEQLADPGQIVVAERTARAARGFRFRELGDRALRGKEALVPVVVLEEERRDAADRGVPGLHAPMVGRDRELSLLRTIYGGVAEERRPSLVTVYGEPGVGKSRLVREFLEWVRSQRPAPYVTFGRCLPYGEGITYWPLAEILKRHADVHDDDPTELVRRKIESSCDQTCASDPSIDVPQTCRGLAYTAGLEFDDAKMSEREPRQIRAEMHAAWRSFVSSLALSAPVVVVIEDIHWADRALLELLDDLAARVIGPVLLVCPARPELLDRHPSWGGGRRNFSSISLEPLSTSDSDRLVRLLLTVDDLPPGVHRQILHRAEGNPFFLEEIVRHLIDDGQIVHRNGTWRAAPTIGSVDIPDTVQAVLAARIDLLSREEKRALQRAAVVGRVFWPGPVGRLLNGDGARVQDTLRRLEELELVLSRIGSAFAGEPEYAFKHILTREVAYESLPRRERGPAHATVARWIEDISARRGMEFVELLAYHYGEAHRGALDDPGTDEESREALRVKTLNGLLDAAEAARRRFAVDKALALAEQAVGLAASPLERARALEQVGTIALNDYQGDLAYQSLHEAADLLLEHAPQDHRSIARVCARTIESPTRWPGSMRTVVPEAEVARYLEIGMAHVDADEDSEEHVRLLIGRAFGPFSAGAGRLPTDEELLAAVAAGERGAEMAQRLGRVDLASAALDGAGSAPLTRGDYRGSIPFTERRMAIVGDVDDPWEAGDIFAMGAWEFGCLGDYRRAVELARRGAARASEEAPGLRIHNVSWAAYAAFHLGDWDVLVAEYLPEVEAALGDRATDPPYFTGHLFGASAFVLDARGDSDGARLVQLLERLGPVEHGRSMAFAAWLAWIHARHGRLNEAKRMLEHADAIPQWVARPHTDMVRAAVMSELGWFDRADGFLRDSRSYAEGAGLLALPAHLDALEGRAAAARGDAGASERLLRSARDTFVDLGCRWEAARAELALAELAAASHPEQAQGWLSTAGPEFERVGSLREIRRAWELRERLG